jgi:hypothetical protein
MAGALRQAARDLTREFQAVDVDGVGFRVKAHGGRQLELLVWPEAGLDNFIEPADDAQAVERASQTFREIVGRYATGQRPPF